MATRRKTQDELYADIERDNQAYREERAYQEWKAWRDAEQDAKFARQRAAQAHTPRRNFAPYFMIGALIAIIGLGVGLVRTRPDLVLGTLAVDAPAQATPRPTSTGAQRMIDAVNQQSTAAEQQTLQQAVPTADTSVPPPLPVEATATAVTQPSSLDSAPAGSLSTTDLTWRPVATPTTMLSPEQYAASQASEEQNQLNTMLQGQTNAQQLVTVHEAERNAQP
jgi:hypothetical protein